VKHGFVVLGIDLEHDAEVVGAALWSRAVEIACGIANQATAQRQPAIVTAGEL
jgi:hypothetical protein